VDTLQRPRRGSRNRIFDTLFHRWHRAPAAVEPATLRSVDDETGAVLDELYSMSPTERATVDPGLYARFVWCGLHE
jgi:hypothetical protein